METPIGDSSIEMGFQTWRWIWCNVNATISPAYHLGTDRHGCTHAFDRCRQILSRRGRVGENECIRDLFRSTAPVINDPTLRSVCKTRSD